MKDWLVIWTESRAEKKVAARLGDAGLEHWLPTVTERHRWTDRWRNVVLPLFPGYLFARATQEEISTLLRTPGVLTLVRSGGRPAQLSHDFVSSLRSALDVPGFHPAAVADPPTSFQPDDEVVVQEGPLAGLRGIVRELRGARQLVVWIDAIGRGVAFTIDGGLLAHRA